MATSMLSVAIIALPVAGIGAAICQHAHRRYERNRLLSNAFDRARWRRMHGVSRSIPILDHVS